MPDVLRDDKVISLTLGWLIAGGVVIATATASVVTVISEFRHNDVQFIEHVRDVEHKFTDLEAEISDVNRRLDTKTERLENLINK